VLKVPDDNSRALKSVERFEEQQLERRGFDPVDVLCKSRNHRDLGLIDEIADGGRCSQSTAGSKVDHPVRKPVIHHFGEFRKFDAVAVKVDASR